MPLGDFHLGRLQPSLPHPLTLNRGGGCQAGHSRPTIEREEDMGDAEERVRVYGLLLEHPEWVPILEEAMAVQQAKAREYQEKGYGESLGFEWFDCHADPQLLHRMVSARLLDITLKTHSSTHFRVRDSELLREAIVGLQVPQVRREAGIPADLFSRIVGLEDIKTILCYAIEAKERVGVLLQGPPASAKTLFLMELARLPDSLYVLAQTMSGPGLALALRVHEPRFLLIDEIDRLDPGDVGVLNSLLATGWVVETKVGKALPIQFSTRVFAAGIRPERLPQDLLSRFIRLRFAAYTREQFEEICRTILPEEGCDGETAGYIAREVWAIHREGADIRQCVQVARLAQGDRSRVEVIIKALRKQGR